MSVKTQAQGIEFQKGLWQDVKDLAKAMNKPIFVDVYSDYCGPCKWMDGAYDKRESTFIWFWGETKVLTFVAPT